MRRILPTVVALLILCGQAVADDRFDTQTVIARQLDAFRAGDAAAAYDYAAPNIRQLFPSPGIFMKMVETGYPPVYRSTNATFGPLTVTNGSIRQEVFLSDAAGGSWIASYTLERQPDGSLKITGCQIRKGSDVGA